MTLQNFESIALPDYFLRLVFEVRMNSFEGYLGDFKVLFEVKLKIIYLRINRLNRGEIREIREILGNSGELSGIQYGA